MPKKQPKKEKVEAISFEVIIDGEETTPSGTKRAKYTDYTKFEPTMVDYLTSSKKITNKEKNQIYNLYRKTAPEELQKAAADEVLRIREQARARSLRYYYRHRELLMKKQRERRQAKRASLSPAPKKPNFFQKILSFLRIR